MIQDPSEDPNYSRSGGPSFYGFAPPMMAAGVVAGGGLAILEMPSLQAYQAALLTLFASAAGCKLGWLSGHMLNLLFKVSPPKQA